MIKRDPHKLWSNPLWGILAALALVVAINFLAAGGDMQCMWSNDPILCAAVKGAS